MDSLMLKEVMCRNLFFTVRWHRVQQPRATQRGPVVCYWCTMSTVCDECCQNVVVMVHFSQNFSRCLVALTESAVGIFLQHTVTKLTVCSEYAAWGCSLMSSSVNETATGSLLWIWLLQLYWWPPFIQENEKLGDRKQIFDSDSFTCRSSSVH